MASCARSNHGPGGSLRPLAVSLAAAVLGLACLPAPAPLRIGTSGDYAPFSERLVDSEDADRYRGFDIALAEAFAASTGRPIEWIPFAWPELLGSLSAGRFDVAMSGVTVRPERSVEGRFSVPVARTGAVLLIDEVRRRELQASASDPESTWRALDLPSLRIGANAGGHLERVTRRHFGAAQIVALSPNARVPEALLSGDVDVVVSDSLEAPRWLRRLPGATALGPFTADWKAWWVDARDPGLARELDAWLLAREADGTLAGLRVEWFGEAGQDETATPLSALLAACDERLALMPFVAGFKRARGQPIVDPAREERVIASGWQAVERAAASRGLPAPDRAAVQGFYRAQIDAAVEVQRDVLGQPPRSELDRFDLERELRPALIRIGDRMAELLLRVARAGLDPSAARGEVLRGLGRHGLSPARRRAVADSIVAVVSAGP